MGTQLFLQPSIFSGEILYFLCCVEYGSGPLYIVHAFKILFSDIGVRLGEFFAPRRPLRPVRKERKVVGAQVREIMIHLYILFHLDVV